MDRSSKLADLTLVSKYYPVANYSYPRKDSVSAAQHHIRNVSQEKGSDGHGDKRSSTDRTSLGSEGSAPGLIDDRTDSEVSVDDDYQYHTHATELWDSFWQAGIQHRQQRQQHSLKGSLAEEELLVHPRKQYPALIPSPQHRTKKDDRALAHQEPAPAWPLRDSPGIKRARKPAAMYTPFPKYLVLPPRCSSSRPSVDGFQPGPSPTSVTTPMSAPVTSKPQRPPRPDESLIPACVKEAAPVNSAFTGFRNPWKSSGRSRPLTPVDHRPMTPLGSRPSTSLDTRPSISLESRPSTSMESRPSTSHEVRPGTAMEMTRTSSSMSDESHRPSTSSQQHAHLRVPPRLHKFKSTPHLKQQSQAPQQSVFEEDDSDCEESGHGRSLFRFHKRSESDMRRPVKNAESALQRSRRDRANTEPSTPDMAESPEGEQHQAEQHSQKHDHAIRRKQSRDVFGRMLGRRSR